MSVDNIVKASFVFGKTATTRSLRQWDYGQVLQFEEIDLPAAYTVHFANQPMSGNAKTQVGGPDGVDIPDEYLTTGLPVYAWVYLHTGADDGETVYSVTIPVTKRPQPTEEPPTPVQQGAIDTAIAALNEGVADAEAAAALLENPGVTVETLPAGSSATGSYSGGTFSFGIPRGATGEPGTPGTDGVSPTVTVTDITGGHRITITDADGPHSFDVMDGESSGGDVTDVQVNGVSVVSGGVANVPIMERGKLGVAKIGGTYGINVNASGQLYVTEPTEREIKNGTQSYIAVTTVHVHESTFYGLAKAAGADMASISSTTVGVYPEAQKSAISQMLNSPVTITGSTPTINALPGVQYECGEVSTLDITLPNSGIVDVTFMSGSTPTVLTINAPTGMTVEWNNDFDSTALDTDTIYEVNFKMVGTKCLGVAGAWT